MTLQYVASECCRCKLTGDIMSDPVIVLTDEDKNLESGTSYEREALLKYLETTGKDRGQTQFVQNTMLKRLLDDYWKSVRSTKNSTA